MANGAEGMTLQMAEATGSDAASIVAFHNATYGDNRKPEHWTWEYGGPYPDLSVFTVARMGGQIIATQGMIPARICIGERIVLSGKSESTLLHPKYRGRNFFTDFYEFAASLCTAKGMDCIWGYTTATRAFRSFGFHTYDDVMCYSACVLRLRGAVARLRQGETRLVRRVVHCAASMLMWLHYLSLRVTYLRTDKLFSCYPRPVHRGDLDDFYERLRVRFPGLIHICIDQQYLEWRIYNHPVFAYRTYFVYRDKRLAAYAFVAVDDKRRAKLTDLSFDSETAGTFLLRKVLRELGREAIDSVSFCGNKRSRAIQRIMDLLRRHGFVQLRKCTPFVVRNLDFVDEGQLMDVSNWYMNGLSTEGFEM